jgi:hypothetical protein
LSQCNPHASSVPSVKAHAGCLFSVPYKQKERALCKFSGNHLQFFVLFPFLKYSLIPRALRYPLNQYALNMSRAYQMIAPRTKTATTMVNMFPMTRFMAHPLPRAKFVLFVRARLQFTLSLEGPCRNQSRMGAALAAEGRRRTHPSPALTNHHIVTPSKARDLLFLSNVSFRQGPACVALPPRSTA